MIIASLLLLQQDAGAPTWRHSYECIGHLKISWASVLGQQHDNYDVFFYSKGCQYCLALERNIVMYALGGGRALYFVEIIPALPFGSFTPRCACDMACLRLAAYPSLFMIEQGCVIDVIIGSHAIAAHYGF